MKKSQKISFPTFKIGSICLGCLDQLRCPMETMYPNWVLMKNHYGQDIKETRPDLWDEFAIDDPEIENGLIKWCPMYCKGE